MENIPKNTKNHSLSEHFADLTNLPDDQPLTLGLILEKLGNKGFGILLIFLALPSALPLPAAGYSVPFGIVILTLAFQMLRGKSTPWLPEKAKSLKFSKTLIEKMVNALNSFFRLTEHLIQPRLRWINSRFGRSLVSVIVIIMGILMCIPIPGTNTIPAGVVFLVGVSISEEDGLFCILAAIAGCFAVGFYVFFIYFAIVLFREHGWEGAKLAKEKVMEFFRSFASQ